LISRCNSGPVPMSHRCSKFRFIELLIFEFVRRGDLWSPAKCFEFAGNLVIIPQFRHCRFTTMTGRPQVAPTVLYDKQLDKSEVDSPPIKTHQTGWFGVFLNMDNEAYSPGNWMPSSSGRKRGQTFSAEVMTEAARWVPISTASGRVLP